MAGLSLRIPSINSIVTLAVTLAALLFLLRLMPENIKQWFRV